MAAAVAAAAAAAARSFPNESGGPTFTTDGQTKRPDRTDARLEPQRRRDNAARSPT